ncbi:MAG: citramalate synthase [Armatimonadia bacterium]
MSDSIHIYDTTLRDGCQAEGIAFSVQDKILVAKRLDDLGVAYVEGGWPNPTSPKDREFFQRAADLPWKTAKIAAFGSTRRADIAPEDDVNLQDLVASRAPVVTIFGKTWDLHVTEVLRTTVEENYRMIEDSVAWLKSQVGEVIFDAEHFFDGFKADREFALECLRAAQRGGADCLTLCDTNGGTLPLEIVDIINEVRSAVPTPLGIHCHNDSGTAVASSILAIQAGCLQVQGTINGFGERTGNANLCTIIPNLQLKLGLQCLPDNQISEITTVSHYVSEIANVLPDPRAPYVGSSAFAHKGGMHVNAVMKMPESFEHIKPEQVGNERRILVSDYSGSSTIFGKLKSLWPDLDRKDPIVSDVLEKVKDLENSGYAFEAAEASLQILAKRLRGELQHLFNLHGYRVTIGKPDEDSEPYSEATVKVSIGDREVHTAADGEGPVNALDKALRKALTELFPKLESLQLVDYKVRVLTADEGTATQVRVLIETTDGQDNWGTVGVHENIIEASWQALVDSILYGLMKNGG